MKKVYFLFLFSILSYHCFSQTKVDSLLGCLSKVSVQEKVHIIYDKENYYSGDTIWLKAFLFIGYQATNLSTNLNIEIYNTMKERVSKNTYPIINSVVDANIILNDTLSEGVYLIRAYTNSMLNYDASFQYLKPIMIHKIGSKKFIEKVEPNLEIFARPEGGVLFT